MKAPSLDGADPVIQDSGKAFSFYIILNTGLIEHALIVGMVASNLEVMVRMDGTDYEQITITRIEQQKRNKHRYNLYQEEQFLFSVHEDILVKHRITGKTTLVDKQWRELVKDEEKQAAYRTALRWLSRRMYFTKEIHTKLQKKEYEEDSIAEAIQQLKNQKYLDDDRFAVQWTEQRMLSQKKGRKWVEQELKQKGLSSVQISQALQQVKPQDEEEKAMLLGERKWKQLDETDPKSRQKLMAYLLRRGYDYNITSKVVKRATKQDSIDDFNS